MGGHRFECVVPMNIDPQRGTGRQGWQGEQFVPPQPVGEQGPLPFVVERTSWE
jgi:hypothetical protein